MQELEKDSPKRESTKSNTIRSWLLFMGPVALLIAVKFIFDL